MYGQAEKNNQANNNRNLAEMPDRHPRAGRDHRRRPPQGAAHAGLRRRGCGKTLLGMEFLVRGATEYDEPGVFMAFEETAEESDAKRRLAGLRPGRPGRRKKIALDYVHIERSEIEETGEYDLEGLFIRLGYAIDSIGAKRVVLDTIEAVCSAA